METKRRYGIVTQTKYYNFVNFGAMLQCYALQQALNKLGVDNTVVDYRTDPLLLTDIDDPHAGQPFPVAFGLPPQLPCNTPC